MRAKEFLILGAGVQGISISSELAHIGKKSLSLIKIESHSLSEFKEGILTIVQLFGVETVKKIYSNSDGKSS